MIDESKVDKALEYLQETEEQYAQARAAVKAQEYLLKSVEAGEFLAVEKGSIDFKRATARASEAYKSAVDDLEQAEYAYSILAARRERAKLTISCFQSMLKAHSETRY